MREIKFRAWDLQNERMVEYPYMFEPWDDFRGQNNYGASFVFFEEWQDVDGGIARPCHIMQFTGLHDKNGKEIYEGDILNVCNGSINGELWMHKPYEVKWVANKGWDICLFCWDENGSNDMDSTHWCEVIGNIYENPELLNQNI